ncbi:hypothetical protein COLO4_34904 [Corchorus olitorius]|uniref:Uncharacterized protein n=1 Tax=Corchorus olitorius TaxID=93759 RepID=A0A1R3GIY6_9ROSI|nr:hypothetical protein COLO4_34904 [Corchorus olitorius]
MLHCVKVEDCLWLHFQILRDRTALPKVKKDVQASTACMPDAKATSSLYAYANAVSSKAPSFHACQVQQQVFVLGLQTWNMGSLHSLRSSHQVYASIILWNDSSTGIITKGITELKDLEVLDLGYKNCSRSLPPELGSNLSLTILKEKVADVMLIHGKC